MKKPIVKPVPTGMYLLKLTKATVLDVLPECPQYGEGLILEFEIQEHEDYSKEYVGRRFLCFSAIPTRKVVKKDNMLNILCSTLLHKDYSQIENFTFPKLIGKICFGKLVFKNGQNRIESIARACIE